MKKENSLKFLCSKFFMVFVFAIGMTLISSTDASAQQGTPYDDAIAVLTQQRDSFAPGSAKYDFAQAAINYLNGLEASIASNPNYLNDFQDQFGTDPLMAAPMRRAHPTVLANYTAGQLASFQNQIDAGSAGQVSQKLQWILDANAY